MEINFKVFQSRLDGVDLIRKTGQVTDIIGQMIVGNVPEAALGSVCKITSQDLSEECFAEVIGVREGKVLLLPYNKISNIGFGSRIEFVGRSIGNKVGYSMLGRVINGMGEPIDGDGDLVCSDYIPLYKSAINPMDRKSISEPLDIGVKTINGFMTVGRGQRVAIMAGSGVGKSVLMGMMARSTQADVNVIAMIGERGREVKDFLHDVLGEEGLKKTIVIAVTNDQSPLVRMRGAHLATAIAEYFSADGKQVLLIMDSLTRFAMAQREIALQSGEPPAAKGYTSSLYPALSKLLERAGNFESGGSITGLYTVLVEGDDMDDPVTDTVRSIVDGHIVLSRRLAQQGIYPAIDILASISRLMDKVSDPEHMRAARNLRRKLSLYRESEDLINVGAYKKGTSAEIDEAIACFAELNRFFRQDLTDKFSFAECIGELISISLRYGGAR
jgi:flagellum-specific ATP synthase